MEKTISTKLRPDHLEDLHATSGLSTETIEQSQIESVEQCRIEAELGFTMANIISLYKIPYLHADGFCRYKCFYSAGKEGPKYLQKKGSGNRLYLSPQVMQSLQDISIPLYITEGEKKALKAAQENLCCVGLSGLWNWSDGKKELIKDFELIKFEGRQVFIVPDNDWQSVNKHGHKKNLVLAVELLARQLKKCGAEVSILNLPQGDEKVGLDDYLCVHSVDEMHSLKEIKISEQKTKNNIQEELVLEIADGMNLFHDQFYEPCAFINHEVVKISSNEFKYQVSREIQSRVGKFPSDYELKKSLNVLAGIAICGCNQQELFVRVAKKDAAIYYDLCGGQVVVIKRAGWYVTQAPILFKRFSHQQKQLRPIRGGNPWRVFDFLNVPSESQLLVLVSIISNFIPDIPHPIFHAYGAQGSGKSSLFRVIKRVCDPSAMEVAISPRSVNELIQYIAHHHVCLLDNLSELPSWLSDILAMACTGAGFSKRMLYTDEDDVILQVKRCVGINGINTLISKPDLMDRSILLPLDRIDNSKRIEETELWGRFEEAKPEILGGVFDALSKALRIYPECSLGWYPRMADFARWGYAIAVALGKSGDEFLKQYQENIERQNEEVIQSNALAQAVISFMEDKSKWEGTVQDFYNELMWQTHVPKDDPSFPKHANQLRRWLNRIKVNLMERGITFEIGKFRSRQGVIIEVFKKSQ